MVDCNYDAEQWASQLNEQCTTRLEEELEALSIGDPLDDERRKLEQAIATLQKAVELVDDENYANSIQKMIDEQRQKLNNVINQIRRRDEEEAEQEAEQSSSKKRVTEAPAASAPASVLPPTGLRPAPKLVLPATGLWPEPIVPALPAIAVPVSTNPNRVSSSMTEDEARFFKTAFMVIKAIGDHLKAVEEEAKTMIAQLYIFRQDPRGDSVVVNLRYNRDRVPQATIQRYHTSLERHDFDQGAMIYVPIASDGSSIKIRFVMLDDSQQLVFGSEQERAEELQLLHRAALYCAEHGIFANYPDAYFAPARSDYLDNQKGDVPALDSLHRPAESVALTLKIGEAREKTSGIATVKYTLASTKRTNEGSVKKLEFHIDPNRHYLIYLLRSPPYVLKRGFDKPQLYDLIDRPAIQYTVAEVCSAVDEELKHPMFQPDFKLGPLKTRFWDLVQTYLSSIWGPELDIYDKDRRAVQYITNAMRTRPLNLPRKGTYLYVQAPPTHGPPHWLPLSTSYQAALRNPSLRVRTYVVDTDLPGNMVWAGDVSSVFDTFSFSKMLYDNRQLLFTLQKASAYLFGYWSFRKACELMYPGGGLLVDSVEPIAEGQAGVVQYVLLLEPKKYLTQVYDATLYKELPNEFLQRNSLIKSMLNAYNRAIVTENFELPMPAQTTELYRIVDRTYAYPESPELNGRGLVPRSVVAPVTMSMYLRRFYARGDQYWDPTRRMELTEDRLHKFVTSDAVKTGMGSSLVYVYPIEQLDVELRRFMIAFLSAEKRLLLVDSVFRSKQLTGKQRIELRTSIKQSPSQLLMPEAYYCFMLQALNQRRKKIGIDQRVLHVAQHVNGSVYGWAMDFESY